MDSLEFNNIFFN